MGRTSSRDGGVKESPHLNSVAASKSGDCGDSLAALHWKKRVSCVPQTATSLARRLVMGKIHPGRKTYGSSGHGGEHLGWSVVLN